MRLRFVLALVCVPSFAHAGAWTQAQGSALSMRNLTYYSTDHYFDARGGRHTQPQFTKYEFQPYLEYGVTNDTTVGGTAYLDMARQSGTSNIGLADPQIFVREKLYQDNHQVVSLEPLLKLPSSFIYSVSPQGGSKSVDLDLSLRYGRNQPMLSVNDYLDTRLGYRVRSRGLSDQVLIDAALGFKLDDSWEILPALRSTLATNLTKATSFSENGDLDYSLLKAEFGVLYHFTSETSLQTTLFDHVAGVQTGEGFGISLGFAQRF